MGYRRAHQLLLEQGWVVNPNRTPRLWREEWLRSPQWRRQRQRLGETADGRIVKLLRSSTSSPREALVIECHRRIDANKTVATLDRFVAKRDSAPALIPCDNGPELTANAVRDWWRFARAGRGYIEPGSPWQNPTSRASAPTPGTSCSRSSFSHALPEGSGPVTRYLVER